MALAQAQQRWMSRGFTNYTFDTRHGCFCTPQTGPVRITVRNGIVVSATFLETGLPVEAADFVYWYTIEQLFDRIPSSADQEGVADITVTYDEVLGYPSLIRVIPEKDVIDGGESYSVTEVTPAD
jgi:hypothetical protein